MSPISKINKSGASREPKTRGQKQSAIAHHDDRYRKLEAEQAKLLEAQKQDMFTDDDDQRLKEIERALAGYDSAMAQANTNPGTVASPEAGTTSDSDTVIQGTTTQDATQQQATGHDAMQQEATGPDTGGLDVTGQRATASTPDPEPTYTNVLGSLSKDLKIKLRLENKFEEKCMSGAPDRPEPLRELVHERKAASRRSGSRYATAEPAASPAPAKPPISPRRSAPPPHMRLEQTAAGPRSGKSLRQRFHADFLELFDLPDDTTYADLDEQQQLLYPAQFANWKKINA
ncbi:hypothetical protein CUC08_Gglean013433 [Alternaria sp. MG1]|nr:hypothetical protein CUC08_Gglean013433 [Alternaria sp. MG1]